LTLTLGKPSDISFLDDIQETGWRITLADTGAETTTGGRVWLLRKYLEGDDLFCLTYGDAVADLDLDALIQQHRASGLAGTISAVKMGGRFGEMQHSDGKVVSFEEKPAVSAGRVNGGYMVFNAKAAWDYFQPNDTYMEQGALLRMMDAGQLGCYLHEGRWQCMDTPREHAILNALWDHGDAFWKRR
jgi:glucose-1-phosphate cytidylyltransferase